MPRPPARARTRARLRLGARARALGLDGRRRLRGLGAGRALQARGGLLQLGDRVGLGLGRKRRRDVDRRARLGDVDDGVAGAALGVAGAALGLVDPLQHLVQATLAVGLLLLQLREALGAGGALLRLLRLHLDLLEPALRLLERALGPLAGAGDRALGPLELLDQLAVAGVATADLLVGRLQLGRDRQLAGHPRLLGRGLDLRRADPGLGDSLLGQVLDLLDLADAALGLGLGLGRLRLDERLLLALLGDAESLLRVGGRGLGRGASGERRPARCGPGRRAVVVASAPPRRRPRPEPRSAAGSRSRGPAPAAERAGRPSPSRLRVPDASPRPRGGARRGRGRARPWRGLSARPSDASSARAAPCGSASRPAARSVPVQARGPGAAPAAGAGHCWVSLGPGAGAAPRAVAVRRALAASKVVAGPVPRPRSPARRAPAARAGTPRERRSVPAGRRPQPPRPARRSGPEPERRVEASAERRPYGRSRSRASSAPRPPNRCRPLPSPP